MLKHYTYENGFKYRPNYKWPKDGSEQNCPKCDEALELVENSETYFGKPWWCVPCQWQFSEEDLNKTVESVNKK
ncbi:MAG: hypothetical protein HOB40_07305 [Candidatus Marinimicrobia bacterium]|jgi:transcription initiation factor IIE alpha subunit|nr:hypothetical protein [Candidatus Neomarinimicrobiota bacterium]MBT3501205.1 hypothetical protein [Candidatus Neomarinimicrobiota bacterium]MBT3839487.1 hypothetical protein [Candidatus Neomarinimicrobiota bacterium]MBT3999387.1 hypothetical protein [Candidatus Neomarinimicrobiota bacterium]MBT4282010.1 hypothetical protein [Candidatus Neomarinimicrobiota bacterium]